MLIPITEEFNDKQGRFDLYDAYDPDQREILYEQKHADIRVFQNNSVTVAAPISELDGTDVQDLNAITVMDLQGSLVIQQGENWSSSSTGHAVGPDPTYNNISTLRTPVVSSVTLSSIMLNQPVDLSGFENDLISVALPDFPASKFDLPECKLRIVAGTSSIELLFSNSINPLTEGDNELLFSMAALSTLNLEQITKVEFVLKRLGSVDPAPVFTTMAIRAIASDWKSGTVDTDTRYGRLRRNPPRDGDLSAAPEYDEFIRWRGSNPPEDDDPRPIDGSVGVILNTGSMAATNSVNLYFRELTEDFNTQLDLNSRSQSELNGLPQPDTGQARFAGVPQTSLNIYTQDDLDLKEMNDLERQPDPLASSYLVYTLQWSSLRTTITISNSEGNGGGGNTGYSFVFPALDPSSEYVFIPSLEENTARASMHKLDATGAITDDVYDTYDIIDSSAFKRRKGRFGWYATLNDGDAIIDSIRDRGFTYAEYKSRPFESITPVEGAELFVGTSPAKEHFEFFAPGIYNEDAFAVVSRDTGRSTSGESYKIVDYGARSLQGLQTNEFLLTDFENTTVEFDIYYPQGPLQAGTRPVASLFALNGSRVIDLLMPEIVPDQWQRVRIALPIDRVFLTGLYRLQIASNSSDSEPVTWWVDKPSISTPSVVWEGRAVIDDPWRANDALWTPYRNVINRDSGGILFPRRGTQLQIRGRGLSQTASINRIQFKPKYAELGNFAASAVPVPSTKPVASFTSTSTNKTVRFTSTSSDPDGYVANVEWNFGDGGYGIGNYVEHTYAEAGSYTVTITATDNNGNKTVNSSVVGV